MTVFAISHRKVVLLLLTACLLSTLLDANDDQKVNGTSRYFLYSIKSGEGFNLRRDVHMRAATLVKALREKTRENWTLVLPPWPLLPHWRTAKPNVNLKWEIFFDLPSLNEYVPSIEFDDYIHREGKKIDKVLRLQHSFSGSTTEWHESVDVSPCANHAPYTKMATDHWKRSVFGVEEVVVRTLLCASVRGFTSTLIPHLLDTRRSVLVEELEVVMHANFGGMDYWQSRYSMVYAHHLREEGNRFMRTTLGYDPSDGDGREEAEGGGGDYISVHLRRRDFLYSRLEDIPSLAGAAKQMNSLLQLYGQNTIFLATDAVPNEKVELKDMVNGHLVWYTPSKLKLHRYGDGGVAIIDQWIASHGKVFVGSTESTFSFRIREDRQMMKFSRESTFNQLCGRKDNDSDHTSCDPPTFWGMPEGLMMEKARKQQKKTEL